MFAMYAITTFCLSAVPAVPKEQMGSASGLFNMVRTIGGSVGIAILVARLSINSQVHHHYLAGRIDPFRLNTLVHHAAVPGAGASILRHGRGPFLRMVYDEMLRQASVLSFIDDFRLLSYIFFGIAPFVFLMRRPAGQAMAAGTH
jgi:DHA2 family multidrug resistance protein